MTALDELRLGERGDVVRFAEDDHLHARQPLLQLVHVLAQGVDLADDRYHRHLDRLDLLVRQTQFLVAHRGTHHRRQGLGVVLRENEAVDNFDLCLRRPRSFLRSQSDEQRPKALALVQRIGQGLQHALGA